MVLCHAHFARPPRPCFVLLCCPSAALLPVHVAQLLAITLLTMSSFMRAMFEAVASAVV